MKKIRLLLIEDNRLLRDGIVALLKKHSDIGAIATLIAHDQLTEKMRSFKPNVLLLDLGLRNQSSIRLVKEIKIHYPNVHIIAMDLIPTQDEVLEFVRAGVSGFILKDATIEEFLKTIRTVYHGTKVLPSLLTGSLFSQIIENAMNGRKESSSKIMESVRMTIRERQVIMLVSQGKTNKEIAQKLNLSIFTIKSHIHNILEKLALHSRVQIAGYAHTSKNFQDIASTISLINE